MDPMNANECQHSPANSQKSIERRKNNKLMLLQNTHPKNGHFGCLESLKYKIKTIATIRTAIMAPMIHLFLLVLVDMFVKMFLLLPMLSSTP